MQIANPDRKEIPMTAKDYQLIADVLKAQAERLAPDDTMNLSHMAGMRLAFHDALRDANPNFNGAKFLTAAAPDPWAYPNYIDGLRRDTAYSDGLIERGLLQPKPDWIYKP